MPASGRGPFRVPGGTPNLNDRESFFRRHFRPPSPLGIIIIALVAAVGAGFLSAVVWSANDREQVLGAPTPPPTPLPADDSVEVATTTTTRPDLSMEGMDKKLRPLIWSVETLDAAGQPVQGAAFSAGALEGRTLLLTSLALVEAATRAPGPEIRVKNGSFSGPATLWTWEEGRDLAVLDVPRGGQPALPWAPETPPLRVGDQIFLVSHDRVTPGLVTGLSPLSIQHNIFVEDPFRGAALVNVKGELLGIGSATYTGGGTPTDTAFFSPTIRTACARALRCPGVDPASVGGPPAPSTTTTNRRGTTTTRRGTTTTRPG
ncbi:MAG: S1C family serine protease [Actinomycetota bacterium]|nr:S1C family serine protease [Actinomycetota bacterium]